MAPLFHSLTYFEIFHELVCYKDHDSGPPGVNPVLLQHSLPWVNFTGLNNVVADFFVCCLSALEPGASFLLTPLALTAPGDPYKKRVAQG